MTDTQTGRTDTTAPADHEALRAELVRRMCEVMRRDAADAVDPATVTDATPCVGGRLLLDSLDVLEFVVSLDRVYGASLRDGAVGRTVLANMGTLTRFVAANRTR